MHARALSTLLLCVLSGCADPLGQEVSYTVRVDVPEELQGRVEGGTVSTCAGIDGRLFEDAVVQRLELPADGSAAGVELAEGGYGIAVRVLNDQCEVIAMVVPRGRSNTEEAPASRRQPEPPDINVDKRATHPDLR